MKPTAELTNDELETMLKEVMSIVEEASAYLTEVGIGEKKFDYGKVYRYLADLTPYTQDPDAPGDLLVITANLYLLENRYQEAAQLLHRANDPKANVMLQDADFYSGYSVRGNTWWARQERIWSTFQGLEQRLRKTTVSNVDALRELMIAWDVYFPTREMMVNGPSSGEKGVICLGLPDGIFSLQPMLYLQKHVPEKVAKNWNVVLEASEYVPDECLLGDRGFPANEIRVDIVSGESAPSGAQTGDSGKVVLVVWHPYLKELARKGRTYEAMQSAICCVNAFLPQSARLLYVDCVALADREPPKSRSFPLPELPGQFEARNMAIDIPLDQVLERRRRRFTRKPIHSTRPRADIIRGETAMPELEEIYFQRKEESEIAMQRYGTCGWFLMIPKDVCGTNFREFRKAVEKSVADAMGDIVRFVGWAESTENYYIDLITMDGGSVVDLLGQCFDDFPECKSIRCSTFYWNAPLRTLNLAEEIAKYQKADTTGPVKELVGADARPALERLISATRWEDSDIPKPNVQWDTQEGSVAYMDDPADLTKVYEDADEEEDDDLDAGTSPHEDPYAQFSELFVKSPDDDAFTTMLKTMACKFAGRELEDPEDPEDEEDADDYDAFEDEVTPEELRDEASVFHAFQKRMRDPRYAAVIEELAKRAAAGPPDKQKSAEDDDDWDEEDVSLIPPGEYESFLASQGEKAKPAQPRHVHNTKRKGLSRKKDKNKRKKKK